MGVDIKICHELMRQSKASLDKVEMRQTYRARADPSTMMDRSRRGQSVVTERTTQAWTRARQGAGRLEVPPAARPPVRPNRSTSALLDTMGVDIKICKEQLRQIRASLDKVEQAHGARSVPDLPEFPQAVGPPFTHYRLFRDVPEDCVWARNLDRQLRTGKFELMPEEEVDALMSYLIDGPSQFQSAVGTPEGPTLYESAVGPPEGPSQFQSAVEPTEGPTLYQSEGQSQYQSAVGPPEGPSQYQSAVGPPEGPSQYQSAVGTLEGPTVYQSEGQSQYQSAVGPTQNQSSVAPPEGPSQYQSAVGPPEGPTLYESALDLFPFNKSQDLGLSRAGQMEADYSDYSQAGGTRESSEEVLRGPPHPSHALLEMELSSITHSTPQPHKILREFFNRKLAPCNSTPRNSGVQGVFESRGSADTAVVEPAQLSFQPSSRGSAERAAEEEEEDSDEDEAEDEKEAPWAPELEPDVVVEAESEEDSEEEAVEEPAAKMEGRIEGTAEEEEDGEEDLEAEGEVVGTAAGFCAGDEEEEEEEEEEGSAEEFSGGDEEADSEGSAEEEKEFGDEEAAEDAANPKEEELPLDVQLVLRAHSGEGHVPQDVTEEKDAAAGLKGASRAENRETLCSGDDRPSPPEREENRCAPYGADEPRSASPREAELLSYSYRAHSTLDEILEAQTLD